MSDVDVQRRQDDDREATRRAEAEKSAGIYAWNYFQYHAGQRQSVFRFYLTLIGAATIAFAYSQRFAHDSADAGTIAKELQPLIGFVFLVASVLFWCLDKRSRHLIKLSEESLKMLESRLAATIADQDRLIELMRRGDVKNRRFPKSELETFRQIYGCIFLLVGTIGAFLINWLLGFGACLLIVIWYVRDLRRRYKKGKVHFRAAQVGS